MKKEFMFLMFALCLSVWVIVVDNVFIPGFDHLTQKRGLYSRYRIKEWKGDGKLDLVKDKIIIYAHSDHAEEFYYLEYKPHFVAAMNNLQAGETITLKYSQGFPKIWQRTLYEIEQGGLPVLRYSEVDLNQKQTFIWKFTGIMGGVFLILCLLSFLNKPKWNKRK